MKAIVCVDKNMGIGKNNTLPWKNKDDLKWFKEFTLNNSLLMGRKTYEGLGMKFLPKRAIFVLSSTPMPGIYMPDGTAAVYIRENSLSNDYFKKDLILCGGASLYEKFLPECDELYMTVLDDSYECDTFFPYSFDTIGKMFNTKTTVRQIEGGNIIKYENK